MDAALGVDAGVDARDVAARCGEEPRVRTIVRQQRGRRIGDGDPWDVRRRLVGRRRQQVSLVLGVEELGVERPSDLSDQLLDVDDREAILQIFAVRDHGLAPMFVDDSRGEDDRDLVDRRERGQRDLDLVRRRGIGSVCSGRMRVT